MRQVLRAAHRRDEAAREDALHAGVVGGHPHDLRHLRARTHPRTAPLGCKQTRAHIDACGRCERTNTHTGETAPRPTRSSAAVRACAAMRRTLTMALLTLIIGAAL